MSDPATAPIDAAPAAEVAKTSVQPDGTPGGAAPIVEEPKVEEPKDDKASPLGAKAEVGPVKYEFKLPEGVKLDETKLGEFSTLGNELGLKPEGAQKLLDYHLTQLSAREASATAAAKDSATTAYTTLTTKWKNEISSDPELSGANADAAHEILGKALDGFFSKEAREAFDLTGAGWNPHIVKGILKMAKALTEGGPTTIGSPRSVKATTPGARLYPSAEKGN